MIKVFIISTLIALTGVEEKRDVMVDTSASTVKWVGKKVTGQHNGTIALKSGRLEMEGDQLVGGTFTIDMTTINCQDLSGEGKGKLEGHLKSNDFFGVEKYPTATFVINKAVPQGSDTYKIVGNITIKDTSEEIQFPATLKEKDGKMVASADIEIDRTKFKIRYGSGSFFDNLGDKTIYDNFNLAVSLVTE